MSKSAKTCGRKNWRATLRLLDAIEAGHLLLSVSGRYRRVYMNEGLGGVRRMVEGEERRRVLTRLRDLKRKKLVEERKVASRLRLSLSDRGTHLHLKYQLKSAPTLQNGGKVLVTFDVPERQRLVREMLRSMLKTAGFKMVHQSAWITDRDVVGVLRRVLATKGARKWIKYYSVQEM